jgi:hypothetical protein
VATPRAFSALDGGTLQLRSPLASRGISAAARIRRLLYALETGNTRRRSTDPSTRRPRKCACLIQLRSVLGDLAPRAASWEGVLARAIATSLQACESYQAPTQTRVPSTCSPYLAPIRELGKALSAE